MRCQKAATCRYSEEGVVETVKHVLLECKAYEEERLEWRVQVEGIAKEGGTFNALLTNNELQNAISDVKNSVKSEGLQGARELLPRVAKTRNRDVDDFRRESGEDTMRVLSGNKGVEGSSGELGYCGVC